MYIYIYKYIYTCVYIYIYIHIVPLGRIRDRGARVALSRGARRGLGGITYLSNATCLIRPHLLYVFFVASRITIICQNCLPPLKKTRVRQLVLDKRLPPN